MRAGKLHKLALVMVVAMIVAGVLACDIFGGPAKPTLSVTSPPSGTTVQVGEDVDVVSTVRDAKGVTRVELAVDDVLYRTDASPSAEGETSWTLEQTWTAADPGMHTLTVTAYNADDVASDPWAISIEVVEEGEATPTSTSGPPPEATDTPEPPPTDTPEPGATDTPEPPPTDTPEPPPTDTPLPPAQPDLTVTELHVTPPDPGWGNSVHARIGVLNDGTAASGPYKVLWRWGSGDFDVCEWPKPALPAGDGGYVECDVPNIYVSYTTVATVDWRDEVEESDETNNSMEVRVSVGPVEADLYISEIRLDPPSPQQGSPVHVGVHIHNGGGTDAGPFRVIWRAAGPTLGCEWDWASLDAGDAAWPQCEYTYGGWNPNYTTTAIVDVDGEVDESDEDNNERVLMVNVRPD